MLRFLIILAFGAMVSFAATPLALAAVTPP
jgi:hypothetical protein